MTDYNNRTPDWVKNAVFYQIFPDRFAWSSRVNKPGLFEKWDSTPTIHGYKGGDLMGVYEKLDYLEDLGINNPSVEEIRQVAQVCCAEGESIHSTWFPVTVAAVEAAIWTADALGEQYKKK